MISTTTDYEDRRERASRALAEALNDGANADELGMGRSMAEAVLDYLEARPRLRSALFYWLTGLTEATGASEQ